MFTLDKNQFGTFNNIGRLEGNDISQKQSVSYLAHSPNTEYLKSAWIDQEEEEQYEKIKKFVSRKKYPDYASV